MMARVFAMACAALLAAGCNTHEVAALPAIQSRESLQEVASGRVPAVDLLFVVGRAAPLMSSTGKGEALTGALERLFAEVEKNVGGMPDLHVAVITADLGDGGRGTCTPSGDNGIFLHALAPGCTASLPTQRFIIDGAPAGDDAAGSTEDRVKNYPDGQSLAETVSCIARAGTVECPFEQPLEAVRRALNGANPENRGFLRDDAWLAIVFLTDRDDCSTEDTAMFRPDGSASALGALSPFRCWEFGVICAPDAPRTPGEKRACRVREGSPYMYSASEYAAFLRELKGGDERILLAGVIGDHGPVVVEERAGALALAPSCGAEPGETDSGALPPTRLLDFLHRFRHSVDTSICGDLGSSMATVGETVRIALGTRCLQGPLADKEPAQPGIQPHCVLTEHGVSLSGEPFARVLRACGSPGEPPETEPGTAMDDAPCYELNPEPELCDAASEPSHIEVQLYPDELSPTSRLSIRCELE